MKSESDLFADYKTFGLTSAAEVIRSVRVSNGYDSYLVEILHSFSQIQAPYEARCSRLKSVESGPGAYVYVHVHEFSTSETTVDAALRWSLTKIGNLQKLSAETAAPPPIPKKRLTKEGFQSSLSKASRKKT